MTPVPSISRWIAAAGLIILSLPLLLSVHHMLVQQSVKHKMQVALKGTTLTTVLLQPEELKWLKPGKEIWLHNSFFDVLSIDSSQTPWKVFGLYDPEDTKLHMKLIRLLHKEQDDEDRNLQIIAGHWLQCGLLPQEWKIVLPTATEIPVLFTRYLFTIPDQKIPTDNPPPWQTSRYSL